MMRSRSVAALGATMCLVVLVNCLSVSDPESGIWAISAIELPSPGVVAGDTMRDSLGKTKPLRVIAYNRQGDSIAATFAFLMLDQGAHLNGAFLVGDTAG